MCVDRSHDDTSRNNSSRTFPFAIDRGRSALAQKKDGRIGKGFPAGYPRRALLGVGSGDGSSRRWWDWGRYAQLFEYDAKEERLYAAEEDTSEISLDM